jgi:hypothetical protein
MIISVHILATEIITNIIWPDVVVGAFSSLSRFQNDIIDVVLFFVRDKPLVYKNSDIKIVLEPLLDDGYIRFSQGFLILHLKGYRHANDSVP